MYMLLLNCITLYREAFLLFSLKLFDYLQYSLKEVNKYFLTLSKINK